MTDSVRQLEALEEDSANVMVVAWCEAGRWVVEGSLWTRSADLSAVDEASLVGTVAEAVALSRLEKQWHSRWTNDGGAGTVV